LRFRTPDTVPLDYATTQHNLGTANLKQAIACYQEALRFWTPEVAPLDYARAKHNLVQTHER